MPRFHRLIGLMLLVGSSVDCGTDTEPAADPHGQSGAGAAAGTGGVEAGSTSGVGGGGGTTPLPPVDPNCTLPDAAFCDAFVKASPGGRAGDLDDARWGFARLGFGCANSFAFPATPLNVCGTWNTVNPGGPDSAFCVTQEGDPRWAEGFHDNTSFNYIAARIRQPFDFEGRTGTLQWEADARTSGGHGWWVETWLTDAPVPGANKHDDQLVSSKEALGVVLALNCGQSAAGAGTAGSGKMGVSDILLVHDYVAQAVYDPFSGPEANARCVTTEQGLLNTLQFKVSTGRIEVWASDAGSNELRQIAEADIDLGFSRGYVQLSHVHYNAHKADVTSFQSYQWARVAFDGPQLPTPRSYEIADPLSPVPAASTCFTNDVFRISYGVTDGVTYDLNAGSGTPSKLSFAGVDPANGKSARLNFDTTYVAAGDTLSYRFNGKEWRDFAVPAISDTWERQGFSVPVPVSDLTAGENTLELGTNTASFAMPPNSMHVANIDLEIELP